ncbi:MAG: hypothetical protein CMB96_03005 [Flavobacteriaceae bacterium]|nr:hypothetical protein [Flavobacteriaceae bacterium]
MLFSYINFDMKQFIILFSGLSHLVYGVFTYTIPFYKTEFIRYGFEDYRLIIGFSQIAFGICLLIGWWSNKLKLFSSFALTLLMAGALGTRICIGDGFLDSTPAFVYLAINLYIFTDTLKSII